MITKNATSHTNKLYKCDTPDRETDNTHQLRVKKTFETGCFHIMVEDARGTKWKLLVFDSAFVELEELRTELIQKNKDYYLFGFSALNYQEGEKKITYFFIRKTHEEISDLMTDRMHGDLRKNYNYKCLIKDEDDI